MRKVADDMGFNNLHKEMKMSFIEVVLTSTLTCTTFVTCHYVLPLKFQ
jgi:hypothetical protein